MRWLATVYTGKPHAASCLFSTLPSAPPHPPPALAHLDHTDLTVMSRRHLPSGPLESGLLIDSWLSAAGMESEEGCPLLLPSAPFLTLVVEFFSLAHDFCELLRRNTLPGGQASRQIRHAGHQPLQGGACGAKERLLSPPHCHYHCSKSRVQQRAGPAGARALEESTLCVA